MHAVDRGDSYNRRTALMTMIPPYTINLTILDLAERIGEAILEATICPPRHPPDKLPSNTFSWPSWKAKCHDTRFCTLSA